MEKQFDSTYKENHLVLDGNTLTIESLFRVAYDNIPVSLADSSINKIVKCREMVENKIESGEIVYGINTGIGEFSETILDDSQLEDFQKFLIYNHAAGIGEPAPIEYIRAAMVSRINVHANGNSGCRLVITQTLIEMLNKGVTPYVCQKGSVGACGDLAPMAQLALVLLGEGKAYYKGELLSGKEAMDSARIEIPGLKARDGLAVINGSNLLTAMSAIYIYKLRNLLKHAEIGASMCLDALKANLRPYDTRLHQLRGFKGSIKSASVIRKMLNNGDLCLGKLKTKVQDAYSLRSTPQVIGAVHDAELYCTSQVEIELNGVGDNPVFIPEGYTKTFADMSSEDKNKISHRVIAFKKLLNFFG